MSVNDDTPAGSSNPRVKHAEGNSDSEDGPQNVGKVLELLRDLLVPFHDANDEAFVTIEDTGSFRTMAIKSGDFRRWMNAQYYSEVRKPLTPFIEQQVVGVLEGQALFEGEERETFVRVGHHGGRTYVDLGDPSGRAVEIDDLGYQVVERPPVAFVRGKGFGRLPIPEEGGRVDELSSVLNLDGDDLDLVVVFLLASLLPVGPYPVLYVSGEQGSAKSTSSRFIRTVIDPHSVPLRGDPRDPRDLLVSAEHSYVVAVDNLSSMPRGLADGLCRLTSGTGQSIRENYSDKGEVLFSASRPVIINGIPELTLRQDLADRSLRVDCQPITDRQRKSEDELHRQFEETHPRVLGALFSAASAGIAGLEAVRSRRLALPRLANVALYAEAAGPALGWEPGKAVALMLSARSTARRLAITSDLSKVLIAFAKGSAAFAPWTGTATHLLVELDAYKGKARLPSAANAFSGRLNELIPALREVGVIITRDRVGHGSRRILTVRYVEPRGDNADGDPE